MSQQTNMTKKRLTQYQQDAISAILGAKETIKNSSLLQRVEDEVNAHPLTIQHFPAVDLPKFLIDCIKSSIRIPQSEWEIIAYIYYNLSLGTLSTEQLASQLGTAYHMTHALCSLWKIDIKNYPI